MTLFSDESTISEEVPIDYENKVAIYDDYCDDMYALNNNDNNETFHLDFNFQSHGSYFVEFAPTTIDENIYYDESIPPIYDDYIDESGFGQVMTLFSD